MCHRNSVLKKKFVTFYFEYAYQEIKLKVWDFSIYFCKSILGNVFPDFVLACDCGFEFVIYKINILIKVYVNPIFFLTQAIHFKSFMLSHARFG